MHHAGGRKAASFQSGEAMRANSSIEAQLHDLELRIRRRGRWRGRPVFYQVLEAELAPILASSANPATVRDRVEAMLLKLGHSPVPPKVPEVAGDAAPLCVVQDRR